MEGTTSLIRKSFESHFRILRLSAPNHNYNQDHIAITKFSVQEYALNMFMKLARRYFIRQVVVEVVIFRDYGQRESKPLMCAVETGYGC